MDSEKHFESKVSQFSVFDWLPLADRPVGCTKLEFRSD